MPAPAIDKVQLLDPNGLSQVRSGYVGRWIVHLPAITSPPGDGLINELDWSVAVPGTDLVVGFFVGNDSDGDPSRFAVDQVLDSAAMPGWVTYFGTFVGDASRWGEPLQIDVWDGVFDLAAWSPTTFITVDGAGSDPGWYGLADPHVTSVAPAAGFPGDTVVITGVGFTGATDVNLGDFGGSFTVDSDTQLTVTVGALPPGRTGLIVHTSAGGGTDFQTFENVFLVHGPQILSVSPNHGRAFDVVVITGEQLGTATQVQFNGTPAASFTIDSDTQITAAVGVGTAPGSGLFVGVFIPGPGFVEFHPFTVDPSPPGPHLTAFSPTHGVAGTTVVLTGTGFLHAFDVNFSGVPAAFTVDSDTQITTSVPVGLPVGDWIVHVQTPFGFTGLGGFRRSGPPPAIYFFRPHRGTPGSVIDVFGDNLNWVTSLRLGTIDLSITIRLPDHLQATIPSGVTGPLGQIVPTGDQSLFLQATSPDGFATAGSPFVLFPALKAVDAGASLDASAVQDLSPGHTGVTMYPLDADHTLLIGGPPPLGTQAAMAVLDHTDPAHMVLGTPVLLPLIADVVSALISPDASLVVVSGQAQNPGAPLDGSVAINGTVAQVFERIGTTLTGAPVQYWTVGPGAAIADQPGAWGGCVLSNGRILSRGHWIALFDPGDLFDPGGWRYVAQLADLSYWELSSGGVGPRLWRSSGEFSSSDVSLGRIDDGHAWYTGTDGAVFFPALGLIAVTDVGRTFGAFVRADLHTDGVLIVLRQETARSEWFRGYVYGNYSGPHDDPLSLLHEFEFHLDPVADTASGGEVHALDGFVVAGAADGFDPTHFQTSPPLYDLDGAPPHNSDAGLDFSIGAPPDFIGTGPAARVIDHQHLYVHEGVLIQSSNFSVGAKPISLRDGRFLAVDGTPATVRVYAIEVVNPALVLTIPLRQRQRDDGLTTGAARVSAGKNAPTSTQRSSRVGRNSYS